MIQPEKKLRFSAFNRRQRNYEIDEREEQKKRLVEVSERFMPKEEFSKIPFDPNIRHRIDDIPNKLIYRALLGKEPAKDP